MKEFDKLAENEQISTEEVSKLIIELYLQLTKIEYDMKRLQDQKKSLREWAKKKNINLKVLDECIKQLKKPKQERENENYHLNLYISILEGLD